VGALTDALLNFSGTRAHFSGLGFEPAPPGPAALRAAVRGALAPRAPLGPRAQGSGGAERGAVVPVAALRLPGLAPVERLVAPGAGVQAGLQVPGDPGGRAAVVAVDPGTVPARNFVAPRVRKAPAVNFEKQFQPKFTNLQKLTKFADKNLNGQI
jgi:hypothetical protein